MKPSKYVVPAPQCIGCGICRAACAAGCIRMVWTKGGMAVPKVDRKRCVGCGQCGAVCPQDPARLRKMAYEAAHSPDPRRFGIEGASGFLAWDTDDARRRRSASGGVVTGLALKMLETGRIDGVVHAMRVEAGRGMPHYRAVLSITSEEITQRRGSAYETIDFSDVLLSLKPDGAYFLIGTPCAVRGFRALAESSPRLAKTRFHLCALVCSHNVTAQFADYMADRHGIPRTARYFVDWRNKDGIPDAGTFNSHIYGADGDLLKMDRYSSGWTDVWRSYAFAPKACCSCSDFWGGDADVSVKDAWGRKDWVADPLGKSVVVLRSPELREVFEQCAFERVPLSESELADMQPPQTFFKMVAAEDKAAYAPWRSVNRANGFFARRMVSGATRFAYRWFGRFGADVARKLFSWLPVPRKVKPASGKMVKNRLILVAGGYGNGNAGDEAQCAETLRILAERYPGYQVRNLTPRPDYSHDGHPAHAHDFAPRVMFFNHGRSHDWYKLTGPIRKIGFLFTSMLLYANAWFVKRDWPVWFLNARKAAMLQELSQASLFFFCGGGYLTGATRSRLWEGALICRLCRVFGVPVVMSGQTMGEWRGRINRFLARWGFRYVRAITLRDNESSMADLAKIGIAGPHVFPTHDDALFCAKSDERPAPVRPYVAVNFHFWGVTAAKRPELLERLHQIVRDTAQALPDASFVFIPMHAKDTRSFDEYVRQYPEDGMTLFEYDYDFRKVRRVIADAELVLTMKHHPIIFAVGEDTPVISLTYSRYYGHKNFGALQQYGVEACYMDMAAEDWREAFASALAKALDVKWFAETVGKGKVLARERKCRFMAYVDGALATGR